jgi:hypothetical protein
VQLNTILANRPVDWGGELRSPAFILPHVITHAFHHKGQVVAILRILGYPAPRAPWQNPFVERLVYVPSGENVWTTSLCGTRDRCVGLCRAIYPGRSYRWARTRQSVARFNRQQWVGLWKFLKLAACITATRAKLLDRGGLPNASVRMQNTPYARLQGEV